MIRSKTWPFPPLVVYFPDVGMLRERKITCHQFSPDVKPSVSIFSLKLDLLHEDGIDTMALILILAHSASIQMHISKRYKVSGL